MPQVLEFTVRHPRRPPPPPPPPPLPATIRAHIKPLDRRTHTERLVSCIRKGREREGMPGGFSSPAGDGNAATGEPWRGLGFGACETFHIGGGEAWDGQRECGALTGWGTPVAQARHNDWSRAGPGTT
ncbi:hypothetical protein PVAP13_3KG040632 [Panicum virgatum]|uniref:Uncharacterized protein n=1 Tax=Panicum virgatum TaxID=38727 RepID=A0A8T0UQW3_PANVG|nr:hypothetical protein PVAP13_3KG040632 [Panicum virgatum]